MGRRKIEIQPITHDRNRSVTFLKRKNGLFKKAYELGVLCSVDVCVIVFAHNGKLHEYCSGDSSAILEKRLKYSGDRDLRRPSDFNNSKGGGGGGGGDKDSDPEDEGDSGAEEPVIAPVNGVKRKATGDGKSGVNNDRSDSFGSSSRDQSNSFGHGTNDHPTSLPPSSHPLSIGGLSTSSYLGSSTPTPTNATTLAQHHQQLAQQFLVTQLQNINPNLNAQPAPSSASGFPFGLGSLNVPPRGGGMILPFAGLGIGGNPAGGLNVNGAGPTGPAVLPPGASAYSNAFLSSLLGNAAAAAVAQQQANNPSPDFPPSQAPALAGLEWPGANPSRPSNGAPPRNSTSSSSLSSTSPQIRQQAHPLASASGVENNWLDLLLGGGGGGGHANLDTGATKANPSSNLFPVWASNNPNSRPQAGSGGQPPASSPGRSETPIDGVPLPDALLALASSTLPRPSSASGQKRSRGGSSPASRATPGHHSDDGRMAVDDHEPNSSTSAAESSRRSPGRAQRDDDDDDGGRSDSGGSDGKRRRTQ